MTITIIDRENDPKIAFNATSTGDSVISISESGTSAHYASLLAKRVTDTLNSPAFKTEVGQDTWVRYHDASDAPTAIIVPSLASRSVSVNMKQPYTNNTMPVKAIAPIGSNIYSKPTENALMISMAVEKYDHDCDGRITELTLQQEMQQVLLQVDREITTKVMAELERLDSTGKKYYQNLKQPALPLAGIEAIYDDIESGIYGAMAKLKQFGTVADDFLIAVTPSLFRVLERMSRRKGHTSVSDFMGTEVYQYSVDQEIAAGSEGIFVVPKSVCAVSFREQANGTVFTAHTTRNANRQSTVIELSAVCDLIASGFTKVSAKDATGAVMSTDVALPLIVKVTFDKS